MRSLVDVEPCACRDVVVMPLNNDKTGARENRQRHTQEKTSDQSEHLLRCPECRFPFVGNAVGAEVQVLQGRAFLLNCNTGSRNT